MKIELDTGFSTNALSEENPRVIREEGKGSVQRTVGSKMMCYHAEHSFTKGHKET